MRKILAALVGLALVACSDATIGPEIPDQPALSHAPGHPTEVSFSVTFPDDDPCTTEFEPTEHMVTISVTAFIHSLPNGNVVTHAERTIATDSGYEGRGQHTLIQNGNVVRFQLNDILSHPDGRRFRAHFVLLVDLRTSPPDVRVVKGELACIKS